MKPEMKKLIIANLPYLLFVYLFGKLGQATAAKHRAAVRQEPLDRPEPRAAPGGGYAPSAGPSFAAPRKYGSSAPTAWSCSPRPTNAGQTENEDTSESSVNL